jgi:hypothetical protein
MRSAAMDSRDGGWKLKLEVPARISAPVRKRSQCRVPSGQAGPFVCRGFQVLRTSYSTKYEVSVRTFNPYFYTSSKVL